MSIQHFYSQTVADGTATSVVRPSDWNSVHNQVLNISGNTSGTSQISGADIVWAGGNNITLSANGSTVTIVGPTTVAQTVQTQASGNIVGQGFTSTTAAGAVVAATQNSAGLLMAVPAFLTTAAQSNHSHNFATTTTNGALIVVGTTNSAGATIGVPTFLTTAAATDITSGRAGTGTTYAGTGINASMTLNTNGLNLALSRVGATETFFATGANTIAGTNTSGSISNDQYVFSGAGILSVGISSNTIVLSVPSGGGAGDGGNTLAVAGSTAGSNSLVLFANSPTVTFGMAGNTITASAAGGGGAAVTESFFQPEMYGATLSTAHANGTVYFRPFELEGYADFDYLMFQQVVSTFSASTASFSASVSAGNASSGTGSWGQTGTLALFTRVNTNETNASFGSIASLSSASYSIGAGYTAAVSWSTNASSATASVSTSAAFSYIKNIDSNGGFTTTATSTNGSTSFSSTSTGVGSFSSSFVMSFPYAHFSGVRPVRVPGWSNPVSNGEYWLMMQQSTATGSTNMSLQRNAVMSSPGALYFTASSNNSYLEYGVSSNIASANWRSGFGSYSASSNTTAAIALSAITSMSSNASLYFAGVGHTY